MSKLLDGMKIENTITNTKGGKYYKTTYNSNLDLFTMASRYMDEEELIRLFNNAYLEDSSLALSNLLYLLDIRNGKGERRIFKVLFKYLCDSYSEDALRVLQFISELGRYDYILEGIDTKINDYVIALIKNQLEVDLKSDNPTLLAKWLPSLRTHNVNNELAKKLLKQLGMSPKEYRVTLSSIRSKINIVEKNLTNRTYENIDYSKVPTKAMLKYTNAFKNNDNVKYYGYLNRVVSGEQKINTEGLFAYEIIKKILSNRKYEEVYDVMWKNQKDVLKGCNTNVLVMADTSGSMMCYDRIPYATSLGLAFYTAERNTGIFKNHFITFSNEPYLCEVKGNTLKEKINNIPHYYASTDIDKAFKLILDTAKVNKLNQTDLPSHLLIISDMEFDDGVYSKGGTNFEGWKKAFNEVGYNLPIIIFWNVAGNTYGVPVTKFTGDVAMVSGFSTNILENLLTLDKYSPVDVMLDKLSVYLEILK